MTVTLYHNPGSLCSQKVRLALAEKGVAYESRVVDIGPRMENVDPWYLALNPRGVVPTLVHDGKPVTDSARIVQYIDATFEGPPLHADDPAGRADDARWLEEADRIPLREISYATIRPPLGWILRRADTIRLRRLTALRAANPDLASLYDEKIADTQRWFGTIRDPAQVAELVRRLEATLDAFDAHMAGRSFVNGARFGVADILWTVVLARLRQLGFGASVDRRPQLRAWYAVARARPSFEAAQVWEGIPWRVVLRSLFARR